MMTFALLPALAVAALGLFAAKMSDLLRISRFERKACGDNTSTVVWAYDAPAKQRRAAGRFTRQGVWFPVRRSGGC